MKIIVGTDGATLNGGAMPKGVWELPYHGVLELHVPGMWPQSSNVVCRANDCVHVSVGGYSYQAGMDGVEVAMWGLGLGMAFWTMVAALSFTRKLLSKSSMSHEI